MISPAETISAQAPFAPAAPGRRARLWLLRGGAGLLVAGSLAYAALPLWLPESWLAQLIARQLSADLRRPVTIEQFTVSWTGGVVITGMAIGEHPGSPNAQLLRVERLRCPLTPLMTLLTGKVDALEILRPEIWLVRDASGALNLSRLPVLERTLLPSLMFTVQDAVCHVWTPKKRQTFHIDSVECRIEPRRALLDLRGWATAVADETPGHATRPARLSFEATATVPRLRPGRDLSLGGSTRIEWDHLALSDLPLALIPALPMEQVGGTTSGSASVQTRSDLTIDFEQQVILEGVRLAGGGLAQPAIVPDAVLRCSGRFDPNADSLLLASLDCRTRGIHLHGEGPAARFEWGGKTPLVMVFSGELTDWAHLRREVPQIGEWADRMGLEIRGTSPFTLEVSRQGSIGRAALRVDATGSEWSIDQGAGHAFRAPTGVTKHLVSSASCDFDTGQLSSSAEMNIGTSRVAAIAAARLEPHAIAGGMDWPAALDAAKTLSAKVELRAGHVEELLGLLPRLRDMPELADWQGPVRLTVEIAARDAGTALAFTAVAADSAQIGWADHFLKPAGSELAMDFSLTVPHAQSGEIEDLRLMARHARGIIQAGEGPSRISYSMRRRDRAAGRELQGAFPGFRCAIPLRVSRMEDLAGLWPWLVTGGVQPRSLSGDLAIHAQAEYFRRPDEEWARALLELDGERLAVRWGDDFIKPAGEACSLRLIGRDQSLAGQREQWLGLSWRQQESELDLAFARGSAGETGDGFQQFNVDARLTDLHRALERVPALADRLKTMKLVGAVEAHLGAIRLDGAETVEVEVEGEQAGFTMPGDRAFEKPVGVPAYVKARLIAADQPGGAGARLELSGQGRIAELVVDSLAGEASLAGRPADASEGLAGWLMLNADARRSLESAWIECAGAARLDERTDALHPALAALRERLTPEGRLGWRMDAAGNAESVRCSAAMDASDASVRVITGNRDLPVIRKPAGSRAVGTISAACAFDPDRARQRIDARASLDLDGNTVGADGRLWASTGGGRITPGDSEWSLELKLDHPERLTPWVPGSGLEQLHGRGLFELAVQGQAGQARLTAGSATLEPLALTSRGCSLVLDGSAFWEPGQLTVPRLSWALGHSGGEISGRLSEAEQGLAGRLVAATDRLDVADLEQHIRSLAVSARDETTLRPFGQVEPMRAALDFLSRCDLDLRGHIDTLVCTPPPGIEVTAGAVTHQVRTERGPVRLAFSSAVQGGHVHGQVETRADDPEPEMHLTYTARRIWPGPLVDEYLRRTFPGMKATGPVTLIDESLQKLLPAPGEPNSPSGSGELIIEGGYVEGRAAPLAVTRIFPGLNLARFEFSYMHSWFTKEPSGRTNHQMIYQGRYYNIYMDGHSEPGGFRYEVGIDFLADFNSRYWARSGQGRIPLFTKTGRIRDDGTIADEEVRYMPPQRILDVLLVKNNPVFTAYHAVRKRVRAEQ